MSGADEADRDELPPGDGSDGGGSNGASGNGGDIDDAHSPLEPLHDIPLFPLPGCVLLPGAILPLHIFERRYRQMMRHATDPLYDGRKLIGIYRIRQGFDPMDDQPMVHEVGCVGTILDSQALPDGRYNLLLRGNQRVRLLAEDEPGVQELNGEAVAYRRADLEPIRCAKAFEIDLGRAREKMKSLCRRPPIVGTPVASQLEKLFASNVPTARLADVLAFDLLEDADDKQRLLEETNVRIRVESLATMLDNQFPEPDSILKLGDRFQVDD
jgi:Lon protease-like protein